ncbi:MAG: hypothetical protein HY804_08820 [Nitrospinae bacterium]|nr:hypothetical protein [Nitrospinota bacterium]
MKTTIRDKVRHHLNPLHVFCSLAWLIKAEKALRTAQSYERRIYNPFFTFLL